MNDALAHLWPKFMMLPECALICRVGRYLSVRLLTIHVPIGRLDQHDQGTVRAQRLWEIGNYPVVSPGVRERKGNSTGHRISSKCRSAISMLRMTNKGVRLSNIYPNPGCSAAVAINSGPKEPKGHVNEKTREPVRSYRRINDTGFPSYRGPNMCNYSPTNRAPVPKKRPRRNFDTASLQCVE
ncbi:hypothetical protein TNCV_4286251 [Trichonephila clavipes]|nr:hypothetical protein TNCV_4286251 [Trichonephila clavipes]